MKSTTNFSQIDDDRGHRSKISTARNKQIAPNNIKKSTHTRRSSPRKTATKAQMYEFASPAAKKITPLKKTIRGIQLY